MHVAAYLSLLACCSVFSWRFGGVPERIGVALLCGAVAVSEIVSRTTHPTFAQIETGYVIVDLATLAAFCALAMKAQRFWPMYLSAVLIAQMATHLLMLSPKLMPFSYSLMLAIWSFAKPPILALAAWRHRQRLAMHGADPSW